MIKYTQELDSDKTRLRSQEAAVFQRDQALHAIVELLKTRSVDAAILQDVEQLVSKQRSADGTQIGQMNPPVLSPTTRPRRARTRTRGPSAATPLPFQPPQKVTAQASSANMKTQSEDTMTKSNGSVNPAEESPSDKLISLFAGITSFFSSKPAEGGSSGS